MKADSAAVEYTGIKRLKSALVRLNVETEHHREIIESAKLHRGIGQENLDNIYNVLKRSYWLPDETAGSMAEFIFSDSSIDKREGSGRSLKLRFKRLPETAEEEKEIHQPAYEYLTDWVRTENRMMNIINSQII